MMGLYKFLLVKEALRPSSKGLPLIEFGYFRQTFFPEKKIFTGKNPTDLFQTYNWEKSSFFNALVVCTTYVYLHSYTQICGRLKLGGTGSV